MEVRKALRLPRLRIKVHKALHMEVHKVLCLPRNLHMEVHKVLCLPRKLELEPLKLELTGARALETRATWS